MCCAGGFLAGQVHRGRDCVVYVAVAVPIVVTLCHRGATRTPVRRRLPTAARCVLPVGQLYRGGPAGCDEAGGRRMLPAAAYGSCALRRMQARDRRRSRAARTGAAFCAPSVTTGLGEGSLAHKHWASHPLGAHGFVRSDYGNACVPCTGVNGSVLAVLIASGLAVVVSIVSPGSPGPARACLFLDWARR